ncbi:two-component system response regulator [Candidatus Acetothermia bacterium]|nr:MAG: two-component system response regulator [Candidatus Acetothermia bacterium]HHK67052.1 response regulator [Candidatus Acetothermia bacterium]
MKRKLILIVDDDHRGLKLTSDLLQASGYATITAADGEQGVKLAKERTPDLVLMDIKLPRLNGVAAMRALKTDPKTKGIPIIAVTAYAMRGDEERLLQQGFDDFLAKPVDIHMLLDRVRFHLHEEE